MESVAFEYLYTANLAVPNSSRGEPPTRRRPKSQNALQTDIMSLYTRIYRGTGYFSNSSPVLLGITVLFLVATVMCHKLAHCPLTLFSSA